VSFDLTRGASKKYSIGSDFPEKCLSEVDKSYSDELYASGEWMRFSRATFLTTLVTTLGGLAFLNFTAYAQSPERSRVTTVIDDRRTVSLTGNLHFLARAEFDAGLASPDHRMERMILVLQPDRSQQASLDALIEAQHDQNSPEYHRWLTPDTFAERFGISQDDVDRVTAWLGRHGFDIEEVPAGRRSIVFSGSVAQVANAFHTSIHRYNDRGALHHANSTDPQIPEALSGVVLGAVTHHDFQRAAMHVRLDRAPEYTSGSTHYLAPGDFATIYDVNALYSGSIDGTGQSIAIVGRTNISLADTQTFRSTFGLPVNNPVVIVNGRDPGIVSMGEVGEANLDVQWSGAVAPKATVKFVVSASTSSTDGVDLSAQYIVSNNLASVMSTSFGSCEVAMGSAERSFYNNLWQQAAAQGITTLISAGDSGAAGCDAASASRAAGGPAVNGLCSTPYSVCVGGTEFDEAGNSTLYWSTTNRASTLASALSYIPEVAWNESGADGGSGLWATGGGASAYYAKPSWQTGPGVPADSKRDVPDVSFTAAGHDGYLVDIQGSFYIVSGTSASSPSFAGLMALVNQKTGSRQGNANTTLYGLASAAASGGAPVFHGTTGGNNSVPGVTGFTAGPHYNQATGLGSPDAFLLVNHWNDVHAPAAAFTLAISPGALTVSRGGKGTITATSTVGGGFNATVQLTATAPAGITASFAPATIAAPGSGSSIVTLSVASTVAPGAYTISISGTSGTTVHSVTATLTVPTPGFTLSATPASLNLAPGGSGSVQIGVTPVNGFTSTVTLSAGTLPAGVTILFNGSQMSVRTSAGTAPGSYPIRITGTSAGVSPSPAVVVTVNVGGFALTSGSNSVTVVRGKTNSLQLHTAVTFGFSSPVALSLTGLPKGVTATFSPATITNPASGASTLTFAASSSATVGTQSVTITATSGSLSQTARISLAIQ
jgi:pseudomonalisin